MSSDPLGTYRRGVDLMESMIERLDAIDALPGWYRWVYGWERRRIERLCYELDAQLSSLAEKLETS